jgi:hypothetical protein
VDGREDHVYNTTDSRGVLGHDVADNETAFVGGSLSIDERRHHLETIALIVLSANALIDLICGVVAGLQQDWTRMSLCLFGRVLAVLFGTTAVVAMGLRDRLDRLDNRCHVDRGAVPTWVRRAPAGVGTFAVVSVAACMSLSWIAGSRGGWLRSGLYLTACAVTVIVFVAILSGVGIGMRLRRLEEHLAAGSSQSRS